MNFLPENIDAYVALNSEKEPELLKELSRETHATVMQPRMLSGHYQGRLLSFLSTLIKPKTILEIGTYTGYSALCLAEGLVEGGTLHTIDNNEELYRLQRRYFDRCGMGVKIIQHKGNALEIIPTLKLTFDLVFIDADKENYGRYFDLVIGSMNRGGFIISDNVLWSGKVIEEAVAKDKDTLALQAYNEKLRTDKRVRTLMLPVRDGVSLSIVR